MGRDDARPVGGLQGGRAPAAAFSAFMRNSTANSPVANLTTSLAPPEDQMEPDDEAYGIIENGADPGQLVDPDGMPLGTSSGADAAGGDHRVDRKWLDWVPSDPPTRSPTTQ